MKSLGDTYKKQRAILSQAIFFSWQKSFTQKKISTDKWKLYARPKVKKKLAWDLRCNAKEMSKRKEN